jgi:hypothetical protein
MISTDPIRPEIFYRRVVKPISIAAHCLWEQMREEARKANEMQACSHMYRTDDSVAKTLQWYGSGLEGG